MQPLLTLAALLWTLAPGLGAAPLLPSILTDHFGYRNGAVKLAYFTADPGATVELRDAATGALAFRAAAVRDRGRDTASPSISGDHVWSADFSGLTLSGRYLVACAALAGQSYPFNIGPSPYAAAARASLKSLYYARCGAAKPPAYAGPWTDQACHLYDRACRPFCDRGNHYGPMHYGTLDLSGGWHDAGDCEKKIGYSVNAGQTLTGDCGEALHYVLAAYELRPGLFASRGSIPESVNGAPDPLNEARWELDWYLKMQRPDGHVLSAVHEPCCYAAAPPSADHSPRLYMPPTYEAEAIFVACTAQASRLMAGVPALAGYAARLRTACLATWAWVARSPDVDPQDLSYTHYLNLKLWAASELGRLDPGRADARAMLARYRDWGALDQNLAQACVAWSAVNALRTPGLDPALAAALRGHLDALAAHLVGVNDNFNSGMDPWLYSWNSNTNKAEAGMDLYWAATLGAPDAQARAQWLAHSEDFLHYLHGANPLDMCYFSNAAALGAGHGVWHLFNGWFGRYDDPKARALFVGKPAGVDDPLYPYWRGNDNFGVRDADASQFGPPPGYVPDGPTYQYKDLGGQSSPPLDGLAQAPYAKAYRDWNWVDPSGAKSRPWIVNESGIGNTGSSLLLCAMASPD